MPSFARGSAGSARNGEIRAPPRPDGGMTASDRAISCHRDSIPASLTAGGIDPRPGSAGKGWSTMALQERLARVVRATSARIAYAVSALLLATLCVVAARYYLSVKAELTEVAMA